MRSRFDQLRHTTTDVDFIQLLSIFYCIQITMGAISSFFEQNIVFFSCSVLYSPRTAQIDLEVLGIIEKVFPSPSQSWNGTIDYLSGHHQMLLILFYGRWHLLATGRDINSYIELLFNRPKYIRKNAVNFQNV